MTNELVRILLGFEDREGMQPVCDRVHTHTGFSAEHGYAEWFFLSPLAAIREQFLTCWQRFDGQKVKLF